MDTHEKKYEEALERAKSAIKECGDNKGRIAMIESIFPELCESEDERVRKGIIELVKQSSEVLDKQNQNNMLAWLEKQKEPELSKDLGEYVAELSKQFPEVPFAKLSRIAVRVKNWLEKQGEPTDEDMKEALRTEYEKGRADAIAEMQKPWSKEDEVKINRIVACLENLNVADNDILLKDVDWLKSLKDRVQPKQEWNKGDMEMLNAAISFVEHSSFTTIGKGKNNTVAWLKSLKSRVIPQSKQEWSEDDEAHINGIIDYLLDYKLFVYEEDMNVANGVQKELDWLKSLQRIGG